MSELLSCPYCGGEMHVRLYDEDFYRAVLGTEYENALLRWSAIKSEAEAIDVWNIRTEDSDER